MRTAIKLQKIINHSNNIDSVKELDIVVTSHLERDLSRYDWSFFYAKDVILLCALTLFDILNIEQYKIKFDENKVVNFRICTYFLLPYEKNILESIDNCKLTSVEEHLLTRTICIDRIQNVEDLISRIEDSALPYTSFLQWGYDIELFEKSSDDKENNNVEEQKIKFFDPHIDIDVLEPQLNDVSEVSMRELFPEGGFVFLIGPKDAGKSLMCFSIVDSLLNKKKFLGLFENFCSGNILYIDTETLPRSLRERCKQFDIIEYCNKKIFLINGYKINFNDNSFEKLESAIVEKNCKYLILDNLTSLLSNGKVYNSYDTSKFYELLLSLQKKNVCIIIVHHISDVTSNSKSLEFKTIGSKEHNIRSSTTIVLQSKNQIKKQKYIEPSVSDIIEKEGLTVGIHFRVCKIAPILTDKYVYAHLPLYSSKWEICSGDLLNFESSICSIKEKSTNSINNNYDLNEKEIKVLKLLKYKNEIKNKDVQECLNVKDSTARNYLNKLLEKGVLIKDGEDNKTVYRIKDHSIIDNLN